MHISKDKTPLLIKIISSITSPSCTKMSSFIDKTGFKDVTILTKKSEFWNDLKKWKFFIIGLYISIITLFFNDKGNESKI